MDLLSKKPMKKKAMQSAERGTVIFSVVLAILLLSGIGIWAMRFTTLSDRASGYSRLALQAQYLSELGIQTSTAYLALPGYAQANYQIAQTTPDTCLSVKSTTKDLTPFCRTITLDELSSTTTASSTNSVLDPLAQGSLGAIARDNGGVRGDFMIELSEPRTVILPGDDISQPLYRQVTLTSYSILRPDDASRTDDATELCLESTAATATRMSMRATSTIGPIY